MSHFFPICTGIFTDNTKGQDAEDHTSLLFPDCSVEIREVHTCYDCLHCIYNNWVKHETFGVIMTNSLT